jgi:hypothetical protein
MGNLGRHKRRRRSSYAHDCKNQDGAKGRTAEEEGNSSLKTAADDQPTTSSALLQKAPPPASTLQKAPPLSGLQKSPSSSTLQKAPPSSTLQKATASSTLQETVLEFTADELSAFLVFLRGDGATSSATSGAASATSATNAASTTGATSASTSGSAASSTSAATNAEDSAATEPITNVDSRDSYPLHCNRQHVDFRKLSEFDLDFDCFAYKINEFGRQQRVSREAVRRAESRATKAIVKAIMEAGDDDQQRALALHRALIDARTRKIAKSAGFKLERMEAMSFHWNQLKKMVEAGSSKTGRSNIDQSLVIDTMLAAVAGDLIRDADGAINLDEKAPPLGATLDLLGLTRKSGTARLKLAIQKRRELLVSKGASRNAKWLVILRRKWKGRRKISPVVKQAVVNWIQSHENVVTSPIYNETILVKEPGSNEKRRVPKLLLEVPVRELHNLLVAPLDQGGLSQSRDADGKIIVSDTTLRRIIKKDLPQLRRMSLRHKQMCGCEICMSMHSMQKSLNAFRKRFVRTLTSDGTIEPTEAIQTYTDNVLPNGESWHEKPRHAIKEIQCPVVAICGYPHMKCVLQRCVLCPEYQVPIFEMDVDESAKTIKFHFYCKATKCSIHGDLPLNAKRCIDCDSLTKKGRIRTRKYLTLLTRAIGKFMNDFYVPLLKQYALHHAYVRILSKNGCGRMRFDWFQNEDTNIVKTIRDYAERLKFEFNDEIQSEHFGASRNLSIEGCSVRYKDELQNVIMVMHSHFSDTSRQDARTTHTHLKALLDHLFQNYLIQPGWLILDDTDGCAKQYRSATALYLLSLIAVTYHVVYDRAIGAPGHGKDEVDGLNAVDKRFIAEKMSLVMTPEANESCKRIASEAMVEGVSKSIAEEAARLCSDMTRMEGVKSEGKYQKREASAAMKKRHYHVHDENSTEHVNLNMKCQPFLAVSQTSNGLKAMYNIRADPDLGLGRVAVRRIPCACEDCRDQLMQEWEPNVEASKQSRYASSTTCDLWEIFEGLNDWNIVQLMPRDDNDEDEIEIIHRIVLDAKVESLSVLAGKNGAFRTEDPDSDGYYLVKWSSAPYELQEARELTEYDPPILVSKGELVADAAYFEKVPRAPRWYTPVAMSTTVRLQQVILADLILHEESEGSRLPNTCNKTEARSEGAQKVSEQDHGRLLDEITRMEILEFVEAEDDIMDYSGSEGEQSMDDGEDEPMDDGDDEEQSMMDDVEQQ